MIFLSLQIRQNEIRAPSFFGCRLIIYNYKRDASPNYVLERVKTCICLRFITISEDFAVILSSPIKIACDDFKFVAFFFSS